MGISTENYFMRLSLSNQRTRWRKYGRVSKNLERRIKLNDSIMRGL
jgi:UTP:GlnB (protein PII) uridylyltransferase